MPHLQKQVINKLPELVNVHVDRLTRDFLLSAYGNPNKSFILGSTPLLLRMFALGANQILSMGEDKLHKPAKRKVGLSLERPLAFETTPIPRTCLHDFGRLLDDHADEIINRSLFVMMLSLKPGTAANNFIKMYNLDPAHEGNLKMRAYRLMDEMHQRCAGKPEKFT